MRKTKTNYLVTTSLLDDARERMSERGGRMVEVDVLTYIHNYPGAHTVSKMAIPVRAYFSVDAHSSAAKMRIKFEENTFKKFGRWWDWEK